MSMTTGTAPTQSLTALVRQLESGAATPADLVRSCLDRIEALEPRIRAWVSVDAEGALAAAEALGRAPARGPLWGIPAGVKDIIDVAGVPSGCGSTVRHGAPAAGDDAACVASLRRAGGIVLGKTVTTEYGYFAPGPTRNPHRPEHTPGGVLQRFGRRGGRGNGPFRVRNPDGRFPDPPRVVLRRGRVRGGGGLTLHGRGHRPEPQPGFHRIPRRRRGRCAHRLGGHSGRRRRTPARSGRRALLLWDGSDVAPVSDGMQAGVQRVLAALRPRGAWVESLGLSAAVRDLTQLHAVVMAYEAARTRAGTGRPGRGHQRSPGAAAGTGPGAARGRIRAGRGRHRRRPARGDRPAPQLRRGAGSGRPGPGAGRPGCDRRSGAEPPVAGHGPARGHRARAEGRRRPAAGTAAHRPAGP